MPLGKDAKDFAIVSLDTGTLRPGLEKVRLSAAGLRLYAFGWKAMRVCQHIMCHLQRTVENKLSSVYGFFHPNTSIHYLE